MSEEIKIKSGSGEIEVKKGDTLWRVNKDCSVDKLPILGVHISDGRAMALCGKLPIEDSEFVYFTETNSRFFRTRNEALLFARGELVMRWQKLGEDIEAIDEELKK